MNSRFREFLRIFKKEVVGICKKMFGNKKIITTVLAYILIIIAGCIYMPPIFWIMFWVVFTGCVDASLKKLWGRPEWKVSSFLYAVLSGLYVAFGFVTGMGWHISKENSFLYALLIEFGIYALLSFLVLYSKDRRIRKEHKNI